MTYFTLFWNFARNRHPAKPFVTVHHQIKSWYWTLLSANKPFLLKTLEPHELPPSTQPHQRTALKLVRFDDNNSMMGNFGMIGNFAVLKISTATHAHSQQLLRAGDVSENKDTNFQQLWESTWHVSITALLSKIIVFQMQIILVNLLTQAYIFMIKRIPTGLNIFTSKNKRCVVSLPVLCICPLLFKGHPATTIIHHEGQSYCVKMPRL